MKASTKVARVSDIFEGKYTNKRVPYMVLEVMDVESVGNCFQIKLKDIFDD